MLKGKKLIRVMLNIVLIVCMSLSVFSMSASAATVTASLELTKGVYYKSSDIDMDGGMMTDLIAPEGSIPDGMKLHQYDSYFVLEGTPGKSGSFSYQATAVYEDDSTDIIRIIVNVSDPAAKPSPSAKPEEKPKVKITKHPTGEYIKEGGSAVFVSRADNADERIWRLVSPDTTVTVPVKDCASYFPGLSVSGQDTERLVLSNIPLELDQWCVEAKYTGNGGPVFSNGARLHVSKAQLLAPKIESQPQSSSLQEGQSTVLSFSASSPDKAELRYQWYENSNNSNAGGRKLKGCTGTKYQPPEREGTYYYYAAVWAVDGDMTGPISYTSPAAISYEKKPLSESPQPVSTPQSSVPGSTENEEDSPVVVIPAEDEEEKDSGNLTLIIIVSGVLLLVLIVCVTLIILKKKPSAKAPAAENEEPPSAEDSYQGLHDGINDAQDYENYKNNKKK